MNFLEINTPPTAARWRCGVMDCNRFLSVCDLVTCQLTSETLREAGSKIAPDRHRMQFDTSGRYRLIWEEAKPKNTQRRQVVASSSSSSIQPPRSNQPPSANQPPRSSQPSSRTNATVSETIDLGLL
jgi:hypothetical protein